MDCPSEILRFGASSDNSIKMLRSKSKPIVYVFDQGRGVLAKTAKALSKLGTKRQCLACGAKYYDLGRKPPVCSRGGASAEPKRAGEQVEERPVAGEATAGTQ